MGLQRPQRTTPAQAERASWRKRVWREDFKEAKKSWKRPSGHLNNLYGHKDGRRGLEKWAMVRCSQKQKVGWGERKADDGG